MLKVQPKATEPINPITIASKNEAKKLGINLTKEMKDWDNENWVLRQKPEEHNGRGQDLPCLWIVRVSIVKMALSPAVTYRFSVLSKSQWSPSQK